MLARTSSSCRAGSELMPRPKKNKNMLRTPKIHQKAKKKELSAWSLNHRPRAYLTFLKWSQLIIYPPMQ